jgi:hypothetical protein
VRDSSLCDPSSFRFFSHRAFNQMVAATEYPMRIYRAIANLDDNKGAALARMLKKEGISISSSTILRIRKMYTTRQMEDGPWIHWRNILKILIGDNNAGIDEREITARKDLLNRLLQRQPVNQGGI